jgi:hypothetical protein
MTLYCLLSSREAPVDFLTLDESLDKEALVITELSSGGSVPELRVTNRSDRNILLLDGEELVGAKQNRVLNVTILIAPKSETVIPVSCVEQGRWSYRTRQFGSESRAMNASLKKRKSETVAENLRQRQSFRSDQGVVWEEIHNKYARMDADPSPTMAMADLYESHKDLSAEYLKAFHSVDQQIGILVFIDGEIAGMELLAKFDAFKQTHPKLVNSYVMDALETAGRSAKPSAQLLKGKASRFIERGQNAQIEVRKSVALGNDLRIESSQVMGSGFGLDGYVLQLSVFVRSNAESHPKGSRMAPASRRRRGAEE